MSPNGFWAYPDILSPKAEIRDRLLKASSMDTNLKVALWNANGILKIKNEFQLFLVNKKIILFVLVRHIYTIKITSPLNDT